MRPVLIAVFLLTATGAFADDWKDPSAKSIGVISLAQLPFEDGSILAGRKVKFPKTTGVFVIPLPFSPGVASIPEFSQVTHVDGNPVSSHEELVAAVNAAGDKTEIKFFRAMKARGPMDWTTKGQATIEVGTNGTNAQKAMNVSEDKVTGKTWVRHKLEGKGPIECYFQLVDGKASNFRAKFITRGKEYLGSTVVRVQCGDERAQISQGFFDWERDIGGSGGVTESCDVAASAELFAFLRIPTGIRNGTVRFESRGEFRDDKTGPDEGVRIDQVVTAFRAYGGTIPE